MHPKELVEHLNKIYSDETIFNRNDDFSFIHAYFHTTEERGFPIGMHSHTFYEINIIIGGSGWHYMNNNCVEATKGSVYVIPENFSHGYYSDCPDDFLILHILLSPCFLERYKDELNSIPGFSLLWDIEPLIREGSSQGMSLRLTESQLAELTPLFNSLLANNEDKPENNVSELAMALEIISKLSLLILKSHQSIEKKHFYDETANVFAIVSTMQYIKDNFSEKIGIETLLKIANMSKSNYIAKFKELSRFTPMKYLTECSHVRMNCFSLLPSIWSYAFSVTWFIPVAMVFPSASDHENSLSLIPETSFPVVLSYTFAVSVVPLSILFSPSATHLYLFRNSFFTDSDGVLPTAIIDLAADTAGVSDCPFILIPSTTRICPL